MTSTDPCDATGHASSSDHAETSGISALLAPCIAAGPPAFWIFGLGVSSGFLGK